VAFLHWLSTIDVMITLLPWHKQDQQQEHQSAKSVTTSVNFIDIPTYVTQLLAGTRGKSITSIKLEIDRRAGASLL